MALRFSMFSRWLLLMFIFIVVYCLNFIFNGKGISISPVRLGSESELLTSFSSVPSLTSLRQLENPAIQLAVVLSLAKEMSHVAEFHSLYNSWCFIQNLTPLSQRVIPDLIVFCEQPSCSLLPPSCLHLSYKQKAEPIARCYYEELFPSIVNAWRTYLYMTSIAFLLTKEYQRAIVHYQWVLRVDQDTILSPGLFYGLIRKHPKALYDMQFGGVGHGTEFTANRTKEIAKKLGYKHVGIHKLCSTWLVHPKDSIVLANLTTRIGRHFLEEEFGQGVPGLENLSETGEWPKWWRDVTSLYAAEIAINHLYFSKLGHQHESSALDHHSHSEASVWEAWSIHCFHNDQDFSKHKYRDDLRDFLQKPSDQRLATMANTTRTQAILKRIIDEYHLIQQSNGKITGTISVRDYVTAIVWQKTHSAVGAINLD